MGSGNVAICILDLRARWRQMVSLTPRPVYCRSNNYCYPLDRRLDAFQKKQVSTIAGNRTSPKPELKSELRWTVVNWIRKWKTDNRKKVCGTTKTEWSWCVKWRFNEEWWWWQPLVNYGRAVSDAVTSSFLSHFTGGAQINVIGQR